MIKNKIYFSFLLLLLFVVACKQNYYPKPTGYLRTDFPEKQYRLFDTAFPYRFEYPVYCFIEPDRDKNAEPYWINIVFPLLKGKIHISYKKLHDNLPALSEDARTLAYKHTVKAEAIDEVLIRHPEKKVYGILYDIRGNVASSIQFTLTDSCRHFLRASLYFYVRPNQDSLMPALKFCRTDIEHLIETFSWK